MAKKRKRGGRPRKLDTERQPSGKVRPQNHDATPEAIQQRASVVGLQHARDQRAGTVLGRLHLLRIISERQREAGERYAAAHRHWARLAGLPARHPTQAAGGEHRDVDPDEWARAKERKDALEHIIGQVQPCKLTQALLESVCIEDCEPSRLQHDGMSAKLQDALRDGLTAVADYYQLPREDAA